MIKLLITSDKSGKNSNNYQLQLAKLQIANYQLQLAITTN